MSDVSIFFDSVTGETHNLGAKTDILIRQDKQNVFVGECKFWYGPKGLLNTVDQALGYLSWRDSQAALLMFVSNKEIGPVLDQVEPTMVQHPYR